jgi:hypothetical protein
VLNLQVRGQVAPGCDRKDSVTHNDLCGYCRNQIPARSVSDYFCGSGCQDLYHQERSDPLGGRAAKQHPTWDQQATHVTTTMNGIRAAFADFGESMRSCGEALAEFNHLTDTEP